MRKFAMILCASLAIATMAEAQKTTASKKQVDWGVKMGMNFSTLSADGAGKPDYKWKTGFATGIYFKVHITKEFLVQPEFLYSAMGAKLDSYGSSEGTSLRVNYFSIPVMGSYKFCKNWSVIAGPQFDFLVKSKSVLDENRSDITNNYEDNSINATAGLQFQPLNALGFSLRYIHGFTDINRDGAYSIKNRGIQFAVAVKL